MSARSPSSSNATSNAPPKGAAETLRKLSTRDRWLATMLVIAGVTLAVVVLAIFLTDGKWLVEESSTSGDGATRMVTTKKYSDTLPLAGVTAGVLLVLLGAFFGRISEITVPGFATVKFWERQLADKVEQKLDIATSDQQLDPDEVEELKETALKDAKALLLEQIGTTSDPPPGAVLDDIADVAVRSALSEAARRYDERRAEMEPGGPRDQQMEKDLEEAELTAKKQKPTLKKMEALFDAPEGGARIDVLGAMRAHPDLRHIDLILRGVQKPRAPFDHDRFLLLAGQELYRFNDDQKRTLRQYIEDQRASGDIKPRHVRWATSERVLCLMKRWEERDSKPR
jgi:hypothetical protein